MIKATISTEQAIGASVSIPKENIPVAGPQGERGPQGEIGPIGPKGEVGPKGERGPQGIKGEVGPAGKDGEVGPQGPQGEKGFEGRQGPKGDIGYTGPQGPAGPTGPQGAVGPQGIKGDKGDTGLTPEEKEYLFQSVSNGKASIASAITDKGVVTTADASFDVMARNISNIETGSGGGGSILEPQGELTQAINFTLDCFGTSSTNVSTFNMTKLIVMLRDRYSGRYYATNMSSPQGLSTTNATGCWGVIDKQYYSTIYTMNLASYPLKEYRGDFKFPTSTSVARDKVTGAIGFLSNIMTLDGPPPEMDFVGFYIRIQSMGGSSYYGEHRVKLQTAQKTDSYEIKNLKTNKTLLDEVIVMDGKNKIIEWKADGFEWPEEWISTTLEEEEGIDENFLVDLEQE